jgi:hypothetical protein
MMDFKLEPRDIARLSAIGNNICKKCGNLLVEGDFVIRIGSRPVKYFHKDCFRPYW